MRHWLEIARELRAKYRHASGAAFIEIAKLLQMADTSDASALATIEAWMREEDEKGQELARRHRAELEAVADRITGGNIHRQLNLSVPEGVDREHVQAILTYGFIVPTGRRQFVGPSHPLPEMHVRSNVGRKLIFTFSEGSYLMAMEFLMKNGVVAVSHVRGSQVGCWLNVKGNEPGVTDAGREIIRAAQKALREKLTRESHHAPRPEEVPQRRKGDKKKHRK